MKHIVQCFVTERENGGTGGENGATKNSFLVMRRRKARRERMRNNCTRFLQPQIHLLFITQTTEI